MKSMICGILCLLVIFNLSGCGSNISISRPYTQEYVAGEGNIKGNVDIDSFAAIDAAFEIGADAEGYAVFKDPEKAFDTLKEKYADGIKLIKKEQSLSPLTRKNYEGYKTFGIQTTKGTDAEQKQAKFVSSFFDIYENSFKS